MGRPDYKLVAKRKIADARGVKVGVGWKTDKGFNIKLDPFIVLNGGEEFWLGLFPEGSYINSGDYSDAGETEDGSDKIPF